METHPAADIYPLDEATIPALAEDIRVNKLLVNLVVYDGMLLDGRRRLAACNLVNVKPRFDDVTGQIDDPISHVISLNSNRRHLDKSQLAMVAQRARKLYEQQGKANMSAGGKAAGGGRRKKQGVEDLPHPAGKVRDQVGAIFGVSGKMVDYARDVQDPDKADPELAKAVDEGRMSVTRGAKLTKRSKAQQRAAAKAAKKSGGRFRSTSLDDLPVDTAEEPAAIGDEVDNWPAALRWAAKQNFVTPSDMAKKQGSTNKSATAWERARLVACDQSRGYIVKDIGDGRYKIRKAVHLQTTEAGDLKSEMLKLHDMAKTAVARMASNSSLMRLTQEEQLAILQAVLRITRAFVDG